MFASVSRTPASWNGNIKSSNENKFDGSNLTQLRIEKGFDTATKFAIAAGISLSTYSPIEAKGVMPTMLNKLKIANTLGVSIDEAFPPAVTNELPVKLTRADKEVLEAQLRMKFGDKLRGECVR